MKLLFSVLLVVTAITGCSASKHMTAEEAHCSNIASAKANEAYDRHTNSIRGKADAISIGAIVAAGFARNKAGKQAYNACMGGYSSITEPVTTVKVNYVEKAEEDNAKLAKERIQQLQREEQAKREFDAYYEKRRAEERREAELKKLYTPLKSH